MGVNNPSLLNWKHEPKHSINHIVLGKGKPGGAWQVGIKIWFVIILLLRCVELVVCLNQHNYDNFT